jgi:hypothetical protein
MVASSFRRPNAEVGVMHSCFHGRLSLEHDKQQRDENDGEGEDGDEDDGEDKKN